MRERNPLVSVIIANFNYGRYLTECIESVLSQTYQNIEIFVSDNASTDESWDILTTFDKRFPGKFSIARNNRNKGAQVNYRTWFSQLSSDYRITLTSDDVLEEKFVEKAVGLLEHYHECEFLIAHRKIITTNNSILEEPPFFNQSCVMYPPGLSLLFMTAAVNPTLSQIVYRVSRSPYNQRVPLTEEGPYREYFRARVNDFLLSLSNPTIYIKEPLVRHREHDQMHTMTAEKYMMNIMGAYGLAFEFMEYARIHAPQFSDEFKSRLPAAIEKHAFTALRYCARFILIGDFELAKKYFFLSQSLCPSVINDAIAINISDIFDEKNQEVRKLKIDAIKNTTNLLRRTASYEPPEPYVTLD